ncbi:MAG: sigma-70 family RNA polymerase sigma factor [Bacteroidetes bacterium]|nr:sigma-70 family RNA polymerase sigma factor [Bacteroidota bacterium]HNR20954.1 sigma-70 family RNA polymerase sigma factor [Bacteroidia bacterium]HNU33721.1 sigma-70 family RNA polymerase sigma factor [Bacteroidia bacterium]
MLPVQEQKNIHEEFLKAYQPLHDNLTRFVQSMVWNKEDVKDVISETLLKTYENFEKLRNKEALLSYMFTIATRIVYKNASKRKIVAEVPDDLVDHASNTESRTELKELYKAINELPEKAREALVMFEINGLSLNEIQQIQGDSLSAVKSRIARARERLIEIMEKQNV